MIKCANQLPAVDRPHFGRLNLFPKLDCWGDVPLDRRLPKSPPPIHQATTAPIQAISIECHATFYLCRRCFRCVWICDERDMFLQTLSQMPKKIQMIAGTHVPIYVVAKWIRDETRNIMCAHLIKWHQHWTNDESAQKEKEWIMQT